MKGDVITVRKSCGPTAQGGSSLFAASRVIIDQYGKEGRTWLFGSALRRPAHVKPGFRTICRDCDDDWAGLVLKPGLWRKIERTRRFEPRSGKVGWPDDLPQFPGQTQIAIARCDWAISYPWLKRAWRVRIFRPSNSFHVAQTLRICCVVLV